MRIHGFTLWSVINTHMQSCPLDEQPSWAEYDSVQAVHKSHPQDNLRIIFDNLQRPDRVRDPRRGLGMTKDLRFWGHQHSICVARRERLSRPEGPNAQEVISATREQEVFSGIYGDTLCQGSGG